MKLSYFPLSTYSQKVLVAFHEKQVPFTPDLIDLRDEKARAAYRERYPLGKVPLLERDDGWKIPESSIIIEYLDGAFDSGTRLIPADPDQARQTRFFDRTYDLYLNESIATLLFQSWKPEEQRDREKIAQAEQRVGVMYDFMEKQLAGRRWAMGDELTMADCAAMPPLFYAQQVFPFEKRKAIASYWERLQARPSVAKVLAEVAPYLRQAA